MFMRRIPVGGLDEFLATVARAWCKGTARASLTVEEVTSANLVRLEPASRLLDELAIIVTVCALGKVDRSNKIREVQKLGGLEGWKEEGKIGVGWRRVG